MAETEGEVLGLLLGEIIYSMKHIFIYIDTLPDPFPAAMGLSQDTLAP